MQQGVNPARIREARKHARMSQEALADRVTDVLATRRCRARNIVRWENGQHEPRAEFVAAIAVATGKGIEFFFTADGDGDDDEDEEAALRRVVDDLTRLLIHRVREVREVRATAHPTPRRRTHDA